MAFAEQRRHRYAEVLAEQVEQRGLDRRDRVDRRAQIERLLAAAAAVAVGEGLLHRLQHPLVRDDQRRGILQRAADLLAAGHLADAGAAGVVGEQQQVAREEGAVRAAQVEQHAVAAGDRDHAQLGDPRRRGSGLGVHLSRR